MGLDDVRATYDRTATAYADRFADELSHKPLDRGLLAAFADLTRDRGRVLDVGCGPGQIAAHLAGLGVAVEGVDLSPAMIAIARHRFAPVRFHVGDMLQLGEADASVIGVVALYAIVHLAPAAIAAAAAEWHRVLAPGGWLLVSFHVGTERLHLDEFLGEPVAVDFQFHERAAIERALGDAGLTVTAHLERQGDAAVEYPSLRAYVLARRAP